MNRVREVFICALIVCASCSATLYWGFQLTKLPTKSMSPTISPNTVLMTERFTFLLREPRRGEIITFKTTGLPGLRPGELFLKRVVGLPGEHLVISNGDLFINSQRLVVTNFNGPILFGIPAGAGANSLQTNLIIPKDSYFVIGDNTTNSLDSSDQCLEEKLLAG